MNAEARLVDRLDTLRSRGWRFIPKTNGHWEVVLPSNYEERYNPEPHWRSTGDHVGLVEALSWAYGFERAIEFVNIANAEKAEKAP